MNNYELVLVRGFDIFYKNPSKKTLESIAKNLGGKYSFCTKQASATHMFDKIIYLEINKIQQIHRFVDDWGQVLGAIHNCHYVRSELYITCSNENASVLQSILY